MTTRILGGNDQPRFELPNEALLTEQPTLAFPRLGHNA